MQFWVKNFIRDPPFSWIPNDIESSKECDKQHLFGKNVQPHYQKKPKQNCIVYGAFISRKTMGQPPLIGNKKNYVIFLKSVRDG